MYPLYGLQLWWVSVLSVPPRDPLADMCTIDCTYDQPSNRRRNATPQYIEALEQKLKRAEAILHTILPNIDLSDPNLEANLQNAQFPISPPGKIEIQPANGMNAGVKTERDTNNADGAKDAQLESMVHATGDLDLDEEGYWDYHGQSSGLSFVRKMREQLGDVFGPWPPAKSRPISQVFDSPKSAVIDSPSEASLQNDLPPRETAKHLSYLAINDASALLRVVHMPTFLRSLDRVYDTTPESFGNEESSFLPLLYAVLALGSLFTRDEIAPESKGYEIALDQGYVKLSFFFFFF